MPMNEEKMGFEGLCWYGPAGTTAEGGTQIPETRDMSITIGTEKGSTKTRAPDGSVPILTERVTGRSFQFDFQTLNVPTNATIAALVSASNSATPIALRLKDYLAGKGYDGDVILEHKHGMSLAGEQTLDFTAKATRSAGRYPQIYV